MFKENYLVRDIGGGKNKISNRIKAIIFDLGKVLIDFDHWLAAKKISSFTQRPSQEIFSLFFDSLLTQSFEEGKISSLDFFQEVKKILGLTLGFEDFLPIWNEIFFLTDKNKTVYSLAKNLARRYTLALLSNINVLHLDYIKKKFPIFDSFHYVFVSCELGFIKPHPLVYQKVLDKLVMKPYEAFYVDDRPELVERANKLGIRGFVFEGVEQLKKDLASCGVQCDI